MMLPVVVVEMLQQLSLRHDDARPMDQVFEDVVLRRRKVHRNPGTMNALLDRIDFQIRRTKGGVGYSLASTDEGFGAGDQLSQIERLGEIVVCARIEQRDDR